MFTKQCLVSTPRQLVYRQLWEWLSVRKKVFHCVSAKNHKDLVFFNRISSVLLKHIDFLVYLFSLRDDESIRYRFPGRNALLMLVYKSTFIMMCFKLKNISRYLKDSRLAAKFPLSAYKPIKPLTSHWLNRVVSDSKCFM